MATWESKYLADFIRICAYRMFDPEHVTLERVKAARFRLNGGQIERSYVLKMLAEEVDNCAKEYRVTWTDGG